MKKISILVQRHAGPTGGILIGKKNDGTWEFPCGVVRVGETEAEAAARVAAEVLGLQVTVGKLEMIGRQKPEDGSVEHIVCGNITHNTHSKENYHVYYDAINKWQAEPKTCVYGEFAYVHPTELSGYGFVGDDANFVAKYAPYVSAAFIPDVRMY